MADDHRTKRRQLFEAAVDLPPGEREAFLRDQCANDDDLRASVDDLLRLDDEPEPDFLQSPVRREHETPPTRADDLPASIGRYRITDLIGTGGMGVVYQAAQESPQRAVAIKVIRPELISEHMLSRFRNEAEILGRLDHPGIASIYEAGTATLNDSAVERPFLVMELLSGEPLVDHMRGLDTAEQLRLFAGICDAVHHAHQKGVIHRDLKPANIIVTSEGQPKVLDFGIARATDADIQAVTVQTDAGQLLGTVPYMSPEQVLGDVSRLDTRSDVYSLGAMLFEMLTGALPHDVRARSIPEAARIIRDEDSTRPGTLVPALRGDLEWILVKALEKDVERRYDSASAFAADIRRHLADEPVLAGPPSASYRLKKFVRRNQTGVVWAAIAIVMLVAGAAAIVGQTVRATRAEKKSGRALVVADREADRARAGMDFLLWAFGHTKRSPSGDEKLTLRETLDLATADIAERFTGRPEAEADIRRLLGRVYEEISAYAPARAQLEIAYELLNDLYREDADTHARGLVEVLVLLQVCERELGHGEAAAARWYWEAADVSQDRLGRKDPALRRAVRAMRKAVIGSERPSRELLSDHLGRVLTAYERGMASDDPNGIYLSFILTLVAQSTSATFAEYAVEYLRAAISIADRMPPEDARRFLAMTLWMEARAPAPPGEEGTRVQAARRLVSGNVAAPSLFFTLDSQGILGDALLQRGRDDDRDEIARLLIDSHRAMRDMTSPDAVAHTQLGPRKALALMRLAGLGLGHQQQDQQVIPLLDRPDVLDELEAGIARETLANVLGHVSRSMLSRTGRSDRWYEVGRSAGERGIELTAPSG